jgi:hypothetical protein
MAQLARSPLCRGEEYAVSDPDRILSSRTIDLGAEP